jgi:nicotinamide-nucleotide amidase
MVDDPPIEERVGEALRSAEQTLATAESCTGGLIASLLTDVSGASDYFDRSVVTYSNDAKQDLLAVSRESLDAQGAVSGPVAEEMARGVRDTADTTWGLATTGIAGPTGGTEGKPVGTVFISVAYAGPWETETSTATVERYMFEGDRLERKDRFARQALADLHDAIQTRQ